MRIFQINRSTNCRSIFNRETTKLFLRKIFETSQKLAEGTALWFMFCPTRQFHQTDVVFIKIVTSEVFCCHLDMIKYQGGLIIYRHNAKSLTKFLKIIIYRHLPVILELIVF